MLHLRHIGPGSGVSAVEGDAKENGVLGVRAAHRFEDDHCFRDGDGALVRGQPIPGGDVLTACGQDFATGLVVVAGQGAV
ncbi:hypothetical protein [Streptomyces huasconensis]|uniref:hypothetical protein n=1 Tax=Streptomyces huasconensis TaxID=1854574 RepID=UPI0036F78C99